MPDSKAKKLWDKNHTTRVVMKLNNKTDADILQHLASVPSMQGYIKNLIREDMKMTKISFEAGTSRYADYGVNFMLGDGGLYAEIKVPDGASDDYGYFFLKSEILRQAAEKGINHLAFWYDGQEHMLAPDAHAIS